MRCRWKRKFLIHKIADVKKFVIDVAGKHKFKIY